MPSFKKNSKIGGLLLTRVEGDTIYINRGEVIIEVVEIQNKKIRLAVKANRTDILITRGELMATKTLTKSESMELKR